MQSLCFNYCLCIVNSRVILIYFFCIIWAFFNYLNIKYLKKNLNKRNIKLNNITVFTGN